MRLEDLRVDEDPEVARLLVVGDVDDEELERLADLRRREADAGRRVHGLGHVVDELAKLGRDRLDLLAALTEALVGVVEDRANHDASFSSSSA